MDKIDLSSSRQNEYTDQTLKSLDCRKQIINSKEFCDCIFKGCNFYESSLEKCKFVDCTFVEGDLSLVHVRNCTFRSIKFQNSKLIGVNWTEASSFKFVEFSNCIINHSTFMGLDLRQAKLVRCTAREADFTESDLTGADCNGTDFSSSRFLRTNLTKANFTKASNYSIDPSLNTLKKTRFSLPEAISLLYSLDIILDDGGFA